MIHTSLELIVKMLNQYMINYLRVDENCVVLNRLIDDNGDVPVANRDKIVVSFVGIEKDALRPFSEHTLREAAGYGTKNVNESYNITVLVSANFDDYTESLKCLDYAGAFFRSNESVDADKYPGMPQGIKKMVIEIPQASYTEMQQLWSLMGAKYLPSMLCKLRVVTDSNSSDADVAMLQVWPASVE